MATVFTQTDIDELDRMIAAGVLSANYNGKQLSFDSFEQLLARRKFIVEQIAAASVNPPNRLKRVRLKFDRGLA